MALCYHQNSRGVNGIFSPLSHGQHGGIKEMSVLNNKLQYWRVCASLDRCQHCLGFSVFFHCIDFVSLHLLLLPAY